MRVHRLAKAVLVFGALVGSSRSALAQDLTGTWRDENGARYVVRQSGSDVCWTMERLPAVSSVFCGTVLPPLISGTWLDLPTGQRRGAGQLVLRVESDNRIVRVSDPGGYGGSTWIREGTTGAGRGAGSTAGTSGGGWTASGSAPVLSVPTVGSAGAPPPSTSSPAGFTRKPGVTYAGGTPVLRYYALRDAFPGACEADCAREAACAAYTYVRPGGYKAGDPPVCYLFSQPGYTVNNDCCSSGERSTQSSGSVTGTWLFRGIAGQICTIAQGDVSRLVLITERGARGDGYLSANNVLNVLFPFGPVQGQISADRNRINWSNGEFWTRAGASAASGGGTSVGGGSGAGERPAGCDNIKGRWNYTGDNSGHHIYVYHEIYPPGSWALGGVEVTTAWPEHAGRWGPATCVGNNRFEFKTSDGKLFFAATYRDGRLVRDDGTTYLRGD